MTSFDLIFEPLGCKPTSIISLLSINTHTFVPFESEIMLFYKMNLTSWLIDEACGKK